MLDKGDDVKLLSIISPIYNCETTIDRMLSSILSQNIDSESYEVILCDDNSTDNWRTIAESYASKLPIIFCSTSEHEIHCPGNTRIDGLSHATGEWVTFIDDDDMLGDNSICHVIEFMQDEHIDFISTQIDEFSSDMKKHGILDSTNRYLIHGRFYRRSFLIQNNINFKENLYTMEDVYFNSLVFSHLFLLEDYDRHIKYVDEIGYKWIINPNSISHSYEQDHKDWFIDAHLAEYIYANTAPFLEMLEKYSMKNISNVHQYTTPLFITAMDVYFRYQSAVFQIGHEIPDKNLDIISQYYHSLSKMFHLNAEDLVDVCITYPENYFNGFRGCVLSSGYFIPEESFYSFVKRILK